jgi:5-methylcytosine-specific restriction endonuclease McrA
MKFQCSSCGLRMASLHFKKPGLMNPSLTSICDICRQRGLDPQNFGNPVVKLFAQTLLYSFSGADSELPTSFSVSREKRKSYEAFLQDYDGNPVAQQQVKRSALNQAIIASEDGSLAFVPSQEREFADNLKGLGIKVSFQLNKVDFIDRERVRAHYHYRCQYCGRKGRSVDHKNPVSLSQDNSMANLILSCSECNRIKSDMPFDLFVKLNSRLTKVNQKLVRYEDALGTLKEAFQERRRYLAGQVHLKGTYQDPELDKIRKQNKHLQDAIDSMQSDYDALRNARKTYFENGWKLYEAGQQQEIV